MWISAVREGRLWRRRTGLPIEARRAHWLGRQFSLPKQLEKAQGMKRGLGAAVGGIDRRDLIEPFAALKKPLLEVTAVAEAIGAQDFEALFGAGQRHLRLLLALTSAR